MTTLAISCAAEGVLSIVAPLALAASVGTALVVDLDPEGPAYPGPASLAELIEQGPRLSDLRPTRKGIAVLRNGGVTPTAAHEVVRALATGWPHLVLRLSSSQRPDTGPVVPVVPLLPGGMTQECDRPAVYQQVGWHEKAPGPALTLGTPARSTVSALLEGRLPSHSRWIRAWRQVWEMSWV
jgi:hypothetical protein